MCENNIPFAIRLRDELRITTEEGHQLRLDARLHWRRRGKVLSGWLGAGSERGRHRLSFAAKPLGGGEWLIIATNARPRFALDGYAKRWAIECVRPTRSDRWRSGPHSATPRPAASTSRIHAGARKIDGNPHEPLLAQAFAAIQADVDALHAELVGLVAKNRGKSADAVRARGASLSLIRHLNTSCGSQ